MSSAVIAFGFASPLMLWGTAFAGIPLIIHLLHRRRYQETNWGAMRFLIAATKKTTRRLRLEQWLLLATRTLILLLLGLAVARPLFESSASMQATQTPTHRILVIDATLSMAFRDGDRTRFERAQALARELINHSRAGDVWQLVRIAGTAPTIVIGRPTQQINPLLEELGQLEQSFGPADLSSVLKELAPLLASAPELPRKEVCFFSDLQEATWRPATIGQTGRIKQQLKDLAERARLVWYDVGSAAAPNVAVTDWRCDAGVVLSGRPTNFSATLRNFTGAPLSDQTVELWLDGRIADTRTIELPASQAVAVEFAPQLTTGEHRCEVRIKSDGLTADDARRVVVNARGELLVLLVNGKPSAEPMGNATDFLRLALAPELVLSPSGRLGARAVSRIRPTVIRESELLSTDLDQSDAVFLCNVARFTDREVEVLRKYVQGGGGLVFCLGDRVQADNYNSLLASGSTPLLPVKLVERRGDPKAKDAIFEFDPGDFSHPIIRPFQGNPGAGLEATKTFAYWKTTLGTGTGTSEPPQVALRFDSGDPAIIDANAGRGRVAVITTSVDREWSTWAVWGQSFIPLMHETLQAVVASGRREQQLLVGQPITSHLKPRPNELTGTWKAPEGAALGVTVDGGEFLLEPAVRPGFHELLIAGANTRSEWFAINVDPSESDLAALTEADLRADLVPGIDIRFETQGVAAGATADPAGAKADADASSPEVRVTTGQQIWVRPLLMLVFCLLLIEQALAWKLSAAGWVLVGLIALWMLSGIWQLTPLGGLLIVLLTAAGSTAAVWRQRLIATPRP